MKVGSLVECIRESYYQTSDLHPVRGGIYTVREIETDGALRFEEIINDVKWQPYGLFEEVSFNQYRFRELQPPMDLSFVEEMQMELAL